MSLHAKMVKQTSAYLPAQEKEDSTVKHYDKKCQWFYIIIKLIP